MHRRRFRSEPAGTGWLFKVDTERGLPIFSEWRDEAVAAPLARGFLSRTQVIFRILASLDWDEGAPKDAFPFFNPL
jgi:hypothetical protein